MEFRQWFNEMPMTNFQRLGDWEPEQKPTQGYSQIRTPKKGYYKDDFGILTNERGVEKIKTKWAKSKEPFNVFVLRSKEGAKEREVGEVNSEYLANKLKLSPEDIQHINNPNTINIVFTNNMGAERMPMNWWTMAHRVGHAIRRIPEYQEYVKILTREMYNLLYQIYDYQKKSEFSSYGYGNPKQSPEKINEKMLLSLAMAIGGMRSARERLLRNFGEFYHELVAQYIIEGKTRFRPPPKGLITGYSWGRPQTSGSYISQEEIEGWTDSINDHVAPMIDHYIGAALKKCIGKIFVM